MKSILSVALVLGSFLTAYSQKGLHVGANFMAISTNIINQNTWGIGREYDYEFTINTSYGLDVGYAFSDQFGIYSGYWFTTLGQDYSDNYSGSDWERSLKLKYNFIPVMFKFTSTKAKVNFLGGAGVLIGTLSSADQEWLRDGNPYNEMRTNPITGDSFNPGDEDVTERFNKSELMLNFDLGGRILLATNLHMDLTLNLGYGLGDINAEDWQIDNPDGDYELSRNAFGGIKLGLTYVLFGKE
jgi:hypothetical protein